MKPRQQKVLALPPGVRMDDVEWEEKKPPTAAVQARLDERWNRYVRRLQAWDKIRRYRAEKAGKKIAKEFRLAAWREWLRAGRSIYGEMTNARLMEVVEATKEYFENLKIAQKMVEKELGPEKKHGHVDKNVGKK